MKKVISILLVLTLCLSLVPAAFASEEPEEILSGEDALAPIVDEDALDIMEPVEVEEAAEVDETEEAPTEDGDYISGDYKYTLSGNKAIIKDYTGNATTLNIPAEINGYPVTSIGFHAFYYHRLTSVTIPSSVTSIEKSAFEGCTKLTSVTIPEGVTSIGDCAFIYCRSLTRVTIPASVTSIGKFAFDGCSSLMNIEVEKNNTAYTSFEGVLFNPEMTIIICYPEGKTAVQYTIPEGVEGIGEYAFKGCSSLTSMTIPASVIYIGERAFKDCSSLTSVIIMEGVRSIMQDAFESCSSLTSVTIPASVTYIGECAFIYCSSLTNVMIPEGVTSICAGAFAYCSSLTSVTIPESVTSIKKGAFVDCSSMTGVYYGGTQTKWNDMSISSQNDPLFFATIHYESYAVTFYTVTYNANGGTGAPSAQTKIYGDPLTLSSGMPTRSGYTFLGWATTNNAATAEYSADGSYTNNADVTLYAVWKLNTYTVTYNANGGTGAPSAQTKTHDVALTLSSTEPTRTVYTFQGWATTSTATIASYQPGGNYTGNADITLYAVWQLSTYTVIYDANGGYGAPSPQTKTHDVALTLSTTIPTREGYTFLGWATTSTAKTAEYSTGGSYTNNTDVTLYAVWKSDYYTVTYDANGGMGAPSAVTQKNNTPHTISSTVPTHRDGVFLGWATTGQTTTPMYKAGNTITSSESLTLYALWKIDGDVNGDSSRTTADLVVLSKYLSGATSAPKYPDVNNDGECDLRDLVSLMKRLAKST